MIDRNEDFMRACRKVVSEAGERELTVREIAVKAARMPARSYYVNYDYIGRALRQGIGGEHRGAARAARLADIETRVRRLMERRGYRFSDALTLVLAGGSPKGFFLSDDAAVRLYLKLTSRRRLRRPLSPRKNEEV